MKILEIRNSFACLNGTPTVANHAVSNDQKVANMYTFGEVKHPLPRKFVDGNIAVPIETFSCKFGHTVVSLIQ